MLFMSLILRTKGVDADLRRHDGWGRWTSRHDGWGLWKGRQ
jgi:hypothetical protein